MTQKTDSGRERRVDRRVRPKASTKATCRKGTLDLGGNIMLGVLDVAETGVRVLLREQLANDQEVAVTLEGPGHSRPLRAVGNVVWCLQTRDSDYCAGIRFRKRLSFSDITRLS
jgi:PilZ domain